MLLRDRYDTAYGICNHDLVDNERPLSLVGQHPKEENLLGSLLYERFDQFVEYDVFKYTGLSWDRFMEHEHHMCERILEKCLKKKNARDKDLSNISQQLEEGLGDG